MTYSQNIYLCKNKHTNIMYKKLLLLLPLFLGIGCFCDNILEHYNILEFNIFVTDSDQIAPIDGIITTDTLVLNLSFKREFIALGSYPLMSKAYGTSCPDYGGLGLNDPLANLTVSSNNNFNDFPVNTSLNETISFPYSDNLEQFITDFSSWPFSTTNFSLPLIFNKKPSQTTHQFKVKMVFESGKELEAETKVIIWN